MQSWREARRRAADRAEIEAAVLAAGLAHLGAAIALGEGDEAAARRHERVDIAVHAPGRGRAERARGIALRRLGRAGVVDRVVLDVLRQALAAIEPLLQLRVGDVARDDQRAGQAEPGLDRVLRQGAADLAHRPGEIDRHHLAAECRLVDLGQKLRRVGFELFEEDAVGGDLAEDLAVGRARHADADRQAGAVARQADDAHVVAEILAAELRADAEAAGQLEHLLLEIAVAVGLAVAVARGRQRVEIAAAGELHRLQVHLGRGAADDDRQVIGRAGGGAEACGSSRREICSSDFGFSTAFVC